MKNLARYFLLSFAVLIFSAHVAFAQTQPSVRQSGSVTANHIVEWVGNNLVKDGGSPAGSGTVTSVGATGDGILFSSTISGSPITTTGTFAFTPLSQSANLFYSSPNGSSGTPTFRAIVPADLPVATTSAKGVVSILNTGGIADASGVLSLSNPSTSTLGGVLSNGASQTSNEWVEYINNSGSPVLGQINFSNLAGTAAIGQGGTGLTTLGSANACLQVNSSGTAYTFNTSCNGSPLTNIYIGTAGAPNPAIQTDATSGLMESVSPSVVGLQAGGNEVLAAHSSGISIGTSYAATAAPANGLIVQGNVGIGTSVATAALLSAGATAQFTLASSTAQPAFNAHPLFDQVVLNYYTSGTTISAPTGMAYADIECKGGGGGGAGVGSTTGGMNSGSGGGSGSYSEVVVTAATFGASQTLSIGAAGSGGAAGANNGTAGGNTSVGTLCVGNGGSPGTVATFGSIGGLGGTAGTGTITIPGENGGSTDGSATTPVTAFSGFGGSGWLGAGGIAAQQNIAGASAGVAGGGCGAGGSGAAGFNSAATAAGGNGSAGCVRIHWHISN